MYRARNVVGLRYVVCVLLVVMLLLCYLTPNAIAYGEDTHYYLKYYLLRKVGFNPEEARIIASADQATDSGGTAPGAFRGSNPRWHALDSTTKNEARQGELWTGVEGAIKDVTKTLEQRLVPFGQFLHFLEDRAVHEGYGSWLGHWYRGHSPDYLSYHSLYDLEVATKTWLSFMRIAYFWLHNNWPPLEDTIWNGVKDTVGAVRDANPYHWYRTPDASKAKDIVNDAIKKEIDPNESVPDPKPFKFGPSGEIIGMIPVQKFSFELAAQVDINSTILNAIWVIESSPYFASHPEASVAVQWLYNFTGSQKTIDPPMNPLAYAITNMTGLAQEDEHVLNETTHISILMLSSVFTRESHVLYLRRCASLPGDGSYLEQAYTSTSLAQPEISKMETAPLEVDYELLTEKFDTAWECMSDAEDEALREVPVGGVLIPADKPRLVLPYVCLVLIMAAAVVATSIYIKSGRAKTDAG